ncbi:MAG: rhomboid family intramembrane serine protease [Thermomicrobia bacterium]|nr:rhomboid family intramembrane serine protease [Thermomicrobia bacterium]
MVPSPAQVRAQLRRPTATHTIIAINVAVFLYGQTMAVRDYTLFLFNWALIPARFTHPANAPDYSLLHSPRALTLISSLFLHSGFTHIALNMFLLLAIGRMLELAIGTPRFVLLYTLAGLGSSLAVLLLYRHSDSPFIGASGAVYGVMGGYFLLLPPGPDRTKTIIWMLAIILLPALIPAHIIQRLTGSDFLANIAHWGHVGGFLTGILTMYLLMLPVRRQRARRLAAHLDDVPTEPVQPPV